MLRNKDILELKRRFKKEACTFTKMCGCYVDANKNKVVELNELAGNVQIELDELHERMNNMSFVEGYVIEPVDNETMYIQEDTNLRIGPSTDYKVAGEIKKNTEVTIIGKVTNNDDKIWYVIKTPDEESIVEGTNDRGGISVKHQMISENVLSETKPTVKKKSTTGSKPAAPSTPTCDCDCDACDCDSSGGNICDWAGCSDAGGGWTCDWSE